MVTYYVKQNEIYTITAVDACRVFNASGVQVTTVPANSSINIKAATNKLKLSDDNAAITKAVSESAGTSEECEAHIANTDIHTTATEKANWNAAVVNVTADLSEHTNDTTAHITTDERTGINTCLEHVDDSTLHERVLNISALFPSSGSGDNFDMFTQTQAVSWANRWLTINGMINRAPAGLKIKYKALDGQFRESIWNGSNVSDPNDWTITVVDQDSVTAMSSHVYDDSIHITTEERVTLNEIATIVTEVVGEYQYVSDRSVEGTTNMSVRWAQVCLTHVPSVTGELTRVIIPCQTSINPTEMSSDPLYLGIWYEDSSGAWQKLAASINTVSQVVATDSVWYFDSVSITSNLKLRFGLISDPENDFSDTSNWVLGGRGVDSAAACNTACYVNNLSGANQNYVLDVTMECRTLVSHVTSGGTSVTEEERETWNNAPNLYAPKTLDTANAVVITDADGNITASTVISVSELNTLNNNVTNLATKLADLESRLAALES